MQRIDHAAIDTLGIPRLLLMEHAGLAVARAARSLCPSPTGPLVVCCGSGFNGGDGLAAARHLHDWGYPLRLMVTGPLARLENEPATYAMMLQRLGLPLIECATPESLKAIAPWFAEGALVIDALLGIGLRGQVREPVASVIALINRSGKPVLAIDIPSGLDGDTGQVQGMAVKATVTVTLGLAKQGCLLAEGPAHTGSLIVDSISIPRTLLEQALR